MQKEDIITKRDDAEARRIIEGRDDAGGGHYRKEG